MKCQHVDFDEYFGTCFDCKATRAQVIADQFKHELQGVYARIQSDLGIEHGDIDPLTADRLANSEDLLATIVGEWIGTLYENEE